MLKYYKNFILCGEIDYFCLLCCESLETTDEVERHIRWEKHRKSVKSLQGPLKDTVFKIEKNYYYCNMCNNVIPTLSAVNEHVKESQCKLNCNTTECGKEIQKEPLAKREFEFIRVSNCMVTKKEWHGVINSMCLFCDRQVNDFADHVNLKGHMVKFIKAELKLVENGWVFRKINPTTYYCFKCKNTVLLECLADHLKSNEHSTKINPEKKGKKLFEIDRENALATCTVCNKIVFWSSLPMSDHRNVHVQANEWIKDKEEEDDEFVALVFQDKGKLRSELKKYGKDNYIKLNEGGGKGYCSLCHTFISAHIRNFRQHVNGIRHTNHMELKGLIKKTKKKDKPRYKTKTIQQLLNEHELLFIKDDPIFFYRDLSIKMLNFMMMACPDLRKEKIICYLCDNTYDKMKNHYAAHKDKFLTTPVITSLLDEFIREIRPGLYHCGICNVPFAGWSVMERHLNLYSHRFAKIESKKYVEEMVKSSLDFFQNDSSEFPDFLD